MDWIKLSAIKTVHSFEIVCIHVKDMVIMQLCFGETKQINICLTILYNNMALQLKFWVPLIGYHLLFVSEW